MHLKFALKCNYSLKTACTLSPKSISSPVSVWSKTTLNTGGVIGWGRPTETFLIMPLTLNVPIFNYFQGNGALRESIKENFPLFTTKKVEIFV